MKALETPTPSSMRKSRSLTETILADDLEVETADESSSESQIFRKKVVGMALIRALLLNDEDSDGGELEARVIKLMVRDVIEEDRRKGGDDSFRDAAKKFLSDIKSSDIGVTGVESSTCGSSKNLFHTKQSRLVERRLTGFLATPVWA
jgi:predicted Rdx family selenoprotein